MLSKQRNKSGTASRGSGDGKEGSVFTKESISFLRGLARNNDRDWFEARRDVYESKLRAPMLHTITAVNDKLAAFAPEHVKAPEKTVLRIYRDTRFSKSKLPYKQHYAAWWGRSGMIKTSGAGFYFHLSAKQLHIAAGLYVPDAEQTLAVRRFLVDHHEEFGKLLEKRALTSKMRLSDPRKLTRAPKGFAADHPAIEVILYRNWGVDVERPVDDALGGRLASLLISHFRAAAPLVDFLNAPLMNAAQAKNKPMFAL